MRMLRVLRLLLEDTCAIFQDFTYNSTNFQISSNPIFIDHVKVDYAKADNAYFEIEGDRINYFGFESA